MCVAGLYAQEATTQFNDPNQSRGIISLHYFGEGGAVLDTKTGKIRLCPILSTKTCAIVTTSGSVYEISYTNDVLLTDGNGNITGVVSASDVDWDDIQLKINMGYYREESVYPELFDGN